MTDALRALTEAGTARFVEWLRAAKNGSRHPPPVSALTDASCSETRQPEVQIAREPRGAPFASRYEFGMYLRDRLGSLVKTQISRDVGLWNWLSLYYVDQLAPQKTDGTRNIFDIEVYVLATKFEYRSYYRHAIRTSWLAASEHGEFSRVLLVPAALPQHGTGVLAHRGELIEQLASRQQVMGSKTIIEGAARMYVDSGTGRPKRGSGGSGRGSPRRLALVLQQLDLTYDLNALTAAQFLDLLPHEFDRWKPTAPAEVPAARRSRSGLLSRLGLRRRDSPQPP